MAYVDAVAELYQAPLATFVAERKRLASELRGAGDRAGAARLAKCGRPPISAWVVNQLYWHARDAFDAMLATATRLRAGELAAAEHRDAIAKLRQRAAAMLSDAGHGATEATLRRVTTTLAALAASGGFDPDPPGALSDDRDPPGFEAAGVSAQLEPREAAKPASAPPPVVRDDPAAKARAEAEAEEQAAKWRAEAERAKRLAERQRLEAALRTARGEIDSREREVTALQQRLAKAETAVVDAREIVEDLARRLEEMKE